MLGRSTLVTNAIESPKPNETKDFMLSLDGRALSLEMRERLKQRVFQFTNVSGVIPCLAVVLVGDDPASKVYVANKIKACEDAGIRNLERHLPKEISQDELIAVVQELNTDPRVHGILVQLPLPPHINSQDIINAINPLKDADGLCPENLGLLVAGSKRVAPCTPSGVIELLKKHNIPMQGQHAVVIGRSQIVGKPMGLLLLEENATVTVCHSQTQDLDKHLQDADIVVVAIGKPEFISASRFRQGSVVVDVGIHRKADGKLCGDVRMDKQSATLKAFSPVPGGVGPMTIAMLLENTLKLAELQTG